MAYFCIVEIKNAKIPNNNTKSKIRIYYHQKNYITKISKVKQYKILLLYLMLTLLTGKTMPRLRVFVKGLQARSKTAVLCFSTTLSTIHLHKKTKSNRIRRTLKDSEKGSTKFSYFL